MYSQSLPTELIVKILSFCDPLTTLRSESVSRAWYSLAHTFESQIWAPKLAHLQTSPIQGETWKKLYRIYKSWSQKFPNLKQSHDDACLDPCEFGVLPVLELQPKIMVNGQRLRAHRRLVVARIGTGTTTLPIQRGDDCQVWLDNAGQVTRGLSIQCQNGIEGQMIIPRARPSGVNVQMIQQTRSHLLICQESRLDDDRVTIRVWNPRIRPNGPWFFSSETESCFGNGLWILTDSLQGAMLCGNSLLVPIGDDPRQVHSCRLYRLLEPSSCTRLHSSSQNHVQAVWECHLPSDQCIQEVTLNETFALIRTHSTQTGPGLLLLSVRLGTILKNIPVPPCLINNASSSFHIAITRFHILLYNPEWLCIQETDLSHAHRPPRLLKLPYVGKPVRLDLSEDDSIVLLAPKCQRGEIMVIDVLGSRSQTLTLRDGFAEGPRYGGSGGLVGRCALGVWFLFVDGFVDESGREKSLGRLRVAWKGLTA